MINNFLWPESYDIDLENVYFQQDRPTCQTSNETIDNFFEYQIYCVPKIFDQ